MNGLPGWLRKVVSFLGVGAFATGLQWAILGLLTETGLASEVVASTIGFALSAFVNYLLNRKLTFASNLPHRVAAPRFAAVALGGLILNASLVWLCADRLGWHWVFAQGVATAGVLASNFVAHSLWTFRHQPKTPALLPRASESVT